MSVGLIEIPGYVTGTWTIDPAHSDAGFTAAGEINRMDFGVSSTAPSPAAA